MKHHAVGEKGKMERNAVSRIMLTLLLVAVLALGSHSGIAQTSETKVYVDPASIIDPTLAPESSFTVSVIVSDVEAEYGCYAWQVMMTFDPSVLQFATVTEGDFLKDQPEGTWFSERIEESWAIFGCATFGPYLGVNGSGTLATVEFLVVGVGESAIYIDYPETKLIEFPLPPGEPIPRLISYTAENGCFNNFGAVQSPEDRIQRLIEKIETWNLPKGIENSLTSKLEDALHLLDIGNENGAIHNLMEFINKAEALRGKKLSEEQADYLISEAQKIIDLISE